MKTLKNKWFQLGLMAVMAFGMSACSDDDEIVPLFPEDKEALTCVANGTTTYELEANMDWKLSSDASWCTLVVNGKEEGTDISGTAGDYTVTFKASEENWKFEDATANITLTMGGKSEVVAVVTRPAKTPMLTIVDEEGATATGFVFGTSSQVTYTIEGNFDFSATVVPEWLEIELLTDENNALTKTAIINIVEKRYAKEETITFADANNSDIFVIVPVTYDGMNPQAIEIVGNPWNWTVSLDGKTYTQQNFGSAATTYQDEVEFKVNALNDKYKFIQLESDGYNIMRKTLDYSTYEEVDINWATIKDDQQGTVKVSISEFTPSWNASSREGYILVLPEALYETANAALADWAEATVLDEYTNYVLMQFSQKLISEGFDIKYYGYQDLAATKITDEATISTLSEKFGTKELYQVSAQQGPLQVSPQYSLEEWDATANNGSWAVFYNDTDYTEQVGGELSYNSNNQCSISFSTYNIEITDTNPVYLVIKNAEGKAIKVLVINLEF